MGRLKLIIKQGSNFSIELYSDNLNNSLLILQAKDSSGDCLRKLIGVSRVGVNPVKIGEMHECLLTVKHLSFEKKVYSPCRILAIVQFPQNVSHSEVKTLFKNAGVELYNDDFNIAKDYYVHAVSLKYLNNGTSMEVTFEIYSKDKRLTLDKFCKAYTGRKLYNDILAQNDCVDTPQEGADFTTKLVKNNLLADAGVALNTDTKLTYLRYVKLVKKEDNDDEKEEKEFEFIQPYLVQYNESFYDFLARTANRCGEFLFFEDGMLHLGLDKNILNKDKTGLDKEKSKEVSYSSVSICDILSDEVAETSYFYHDGTSKNAAKPQGGYIYNWDVPLDDYLMTLTEDQFTTFITEWTGTWQKKVFDVFSITLNHKSIPSLLGGYVSQIMNFATPLVSLKPIKINRGYNKRFIDCLSDEQKNESGSKVIGAPFSTIWDASTIKSRHADTLNTAFYDIVRKNEEEVSRNAVSVDLGTNDMNFKLGSLVHLKTNDDSPQVYIVVEIKGESYVKDNDTIINSQLLLLPLTEGNEEDVCWATPPFHAVDSVRRSSPQVAVVARNEDPSGLGRVRIRYPWQSDTDDMSPWIRMTTPFATKDGGGMYFAPNEGDEILVDYENGNIERPYMLGSLYTGTSKVFKSCKSVFVSDNYADYVIRTIGSANGQRIIMTDPKGIEGAIESLWGGYSWMKLVVPGMNDLLEDYHALAGSMELTDKYGIYSIRMSTSDRSVSIKSPFGNVGISALTGISLNAPNGKISIYGKDVDITASNTLNITSGVAASDERSKMQMINDFIDYELLPTLTQSIFDEVIGPFIDLRLLRTIIEAFVKPKAGTLKIKSFRYLLMEAGKGKAVVPSRAYTATGFQYQLDQDQSEARQVSELMQVLPCVIDKWFETLLGKYKVAFYVVSNTINFIRTHTKKDEQTFWGEAMADFNTKMTELIQKSIDNKKCQYKADDFKLRSDKDKKLLDEVLSDCHNAIRGYVDIALQPEDDLSWCDINISKSVLKKDVIKQLKLKYPGSGDATRAASMFNIPLLSLDSLLVTKAIRIYKRKFVYLYLKDYTRISSNYNNDKLDLDNDDDWSAESWEKYVDGLIPNGSLASDNSFKARRLKVLPYQVKQSLSVIKTQACQDFALVNWYKSKDVWGAIKEGEILFSDKAGYTVNFEHGHLNHTRNFGYMDVLKRQLKDI